MKTEVQAWGDLEENYSPMRGDLPMWSLPQTIVSLGPATYLLESMVRNDEIRFAEDLVGFERGQGRRTSGRGCSRSGVALLLAEPGGAQLPGHGGGAAVTRRTPGAPEDTGASGPNGTQNTHVK